MIVAAAAAAAVAVAIAAAVKVIPGTQLFQAAVFVFILQLAVVLLRVVKMSARIILLMMTFTFAGIQEL